MNIYARQRMDASATQVLEMKTMMVTYNIHGLFNDRRMSVKLRRVLKNVRTI